LHFEHSRIENAEFHSVNAYRKPIFLRLGALLGSLAVIAGAFGAHALEGQLDADQMDTYQIAVRYQFYHALALLVVGLLLQFGHKKWLLWSGWLFFAGILCFSGSLYLLTFRESLTLALALNWLGPVTPLGGFLFILAWLALLGSTLQFRE
jgi:uncharacterized membrane protein YgdD (TMEM256/DUF423 family)